MASVACNQWKQDALAAYRSGKTFKMALYTGTTLGASTAAYTTTNELAAGNGYTTGGVTLTTVTDGLSGSTAFIDAADATFSSLVKTGIRQALIYDAASPYRAVAVCTFDADQSVSGDFVVRIPGAGGTGFVAIT